MIEYEMPDGRRAYVSVLRIARLEPLDDAGEGERTRIVLTNGSSVPAASEINDLVRVIDNMLLQLLWIQSGRKGAKPEI